VVVNLEMAQKNFSLRKRRELCDPFLCCLLAFFPLLSAL
jgi:hypothetical protein